MFIQTKRLQLKSIDAAAVAVLADLLTDETVKKTYMVPDFSSREEAQEMAQRIRLLSEDAEKNVAGIYLGAQLIGLLNQTEVHGDRVEVGIAILPQYHGQGYGTEAMTGAIGHFFDLGFREVTAGAFSQNLASIRMLQKSGMKPDNRQERIFYRGAEHACVYYCVENTNRTM